MRFLLFRFGFVNPSFGFVNPNFVLCHPEPSAAGVESRNLHFAARDAIFSLPNDHSSDCHRERSAAGVESRNLHFRLTRHPLRSLSSRALRLALLA